MACGKFAEPILDLIDDLAGGGDERPAYKAILDELIGWLSGDQISEFVDDFRRHWEVPNERTG